MSLFATVAIVCTMSACSDYVVDTASVVSDANVNTEQVSNEFGAVWEDEQKLNKLVDRIQYW